MIKKILHITILVIMMVSTMGFSITKHYCGEDLVDLSVSGDVETCCDIAEGDCCHNEEQTYQLDQEYTSTVVINHVNYISFVIFEVPQFLIESLGGTNHFLSVASRGESPPPRDVLHFLADIQVYRL
ncbi:HYC_CC_PP family protein [Sunxiuqinia sp. sy24]|uniref:HYC_CC_PP family protein n=1 Tax=Sunxiuqinia sp. sy24 TaxID=3461495 RepID=UPI004046127F